MSNWKKVQNKCNFFTHLKTCWNPMKKCANDQEPSCSIRPPPPSLALEQLGHSTSCLHYINFITWTVLRHQHTCCNCNPAHIQTLFESQSISARYRKHWLIVLYYSRYEIHAVNKSQYKNVCAFVTSLLNINLKILPIRARSGALSDHQCWSLHSINHSVII